MNLKSFLSIIFCFILLTSCRDKQSTEETDTLNMEENEFSTIDRDTSSDTDDQEGARQDRDTVGQSGVSTNSKVDEPGDISTTRPNTGKSFTGQYIKIGNEDDSACACYCLDLSAGNTELCLIEGDMFIKARLQKNSDNSFDVFLVEPSTRNIQGKDIPWQDFDRNSAIATIKLASNGELELDWLGFKINGDIAVDYAILGKKTLEGKYKKK